MLVGQNIPEVPDKLRAEDGVGSAAHFGVHLVLSVTVPVSRSSPTLFDRSLCPLASKIASVDNEIRPGHKGRCIR
jgi:hypothetical protein